MGTVSPHFKNTILSYLQGRAENDALFATNFNKPEKNIDDCITYILNTVQSMGVNGLTDDEVYSMAVHYYDEDNIAIGKAIDCQVVVNHTVELTEEEKEQARKEAMQRCQEEAYREMKKRPNTKKSETTESNIQQTSLF